MLLCLVLSLNVSWGGITYSQQTSDVNKTYISSEDYIGYPRPRNPYLGMKIGPNPSTEKIYVELYGLFSIKNITSFTLVDIWGRKVLDHSTVARINSNGSRSHFSVYLQSLPSGAYLAILIADKYIISKRICIIR